MLEYPPPNFHFIVVFDADGAVPDFDFSDDFKFQEVSGLNVDIETETYGEAGGHHHVHQLPVRAKYSDLVLKRGFVPTGSGLYSWIKTSIENFRFTPVDLRISLLNEDHEPLATWSVFQAIPKRWEMGGFNAQRSEVAIETITLSYQYFVMDL